MPDDPQQQLAAVLAGPLPPTSLCADVVADWLERFVKISPGDYLVEGDGAGGLHVVTPKLDVGFGPDAAITAIRRIA